MATTPSNIDRIESAANITLQVSRGASSGSDSSGNKAATMTVPISRLDTTKDIQISEFRESSLKASSYSITAISYSGTMMFKGSTLTRVLGDGEVKTLNDLLYDSNGVPEPVSIAITHDSNGESDTYQHVLVNSESYQVRSEEATETAFDWIAMDRTSDQPEASGE